MGGAKHGWFHFAHVKEHGVVRDELDQGGRCSGWVSAKIKERCDVGKAVASRVRERLVQPRGRELLTPFPKDGLYHSPSLRPPASCVKPPSSSSCSYRHIHPYTTRLTVHTHRAAQDRRAPLGETYLLPAVQYSKHNQRLILLGRRWLFASSHLDRQTVDRYSPILRHTCASGLGRRRLVRYPYAFRQTTSLRVDLHLRLHSTILALPTFNTDLDNEVDRA